LGTVSFTVGLFTGIYAASIASYYGASPAQAVLIGISAGILAGLGFAYVAGAAAAGTLVTSTYLAIGRIVGPRVAILFLQLLHAVGVRPERQNLTTLPTPNNIGTVGMGRLMNWGAGTNPGQALERARELSNPTMAGSVVERLRAAGLTPEMAAAWRDAYAREALRNPPSPLLDLSAPAAYGNASAATRALLMDAAEKALH
jgi:hypothetical protein